jgi:hypothetical protein
MVAGLALGAPASAAVLLDVEGVLTPGEGREFFVGRAAGRPQRLTLTLEADAPLRLETLIDVSFCEQIFDGDGELVDEFCDNFDVPGPEGEGRRLAFRFATDGFTDEPRVPCPPGFSCRVQRAEVVETLILDNFTGEASRYDLRLVASAVPEPAGWAMMILGFGVVGAGLRRGRILAV